MKLGEARGGLWWLPGKRWPRSAVVHVTKVQRAAAGLKPEGLKGRPVFGLGALKQRWRLLLQVSCALLGICWFGRSAPEWAPQIRTPVDVVLLDGGPTAICKGFTGQGKEQMSAYCRGAVNFFKAPRAKGFPQKCCFGLASLAFLCSYGAGLSGRGFLAAPA